MAPNQQGRENSPRSEGEQGLVIEGQGLAEKGFREKHAAADRQCEQDEAQKKHAKEQRFHGQERWQAGQAALCATRKTEIYFAKL